MEFNGLFGQIVTTKPKAKKDKARGCDACPMNNVPGIKKIMGRIRGRDILIVGQSPGPEENDAGREFVGRSGQFLWEELDKVGVTRKDCDIQNCVRCFPADATEGSYDVYLKMRSPTNEEIHCCSIHTEKAMEQVTAKHILILGQVAAKAFLETRTVPSKKIFWSEKHQATIYLADHPAFFIRGYGAGERLEGFRSSLQALADAWRGNQASGASESPQESTNGIHRASTFGYMRKQRYIWVATREKAIKAAQLILARKHRDRAAVDVEDDDGKIFACGFCIRPGITFVFDMTVPIVREVARRLLQNPTLHKVMQYGCTDVEKLASEKIFVHGFDFDTNIGAYFMQPGLGDYGLTAIAERQFPEFTGYKDEVVIELLKILPQDTEIPKGFPKLTTESKGKWMGSHGHYHLSKLPPDTIRLYNGADCDLTKRAELSQRDAVECPAALMNIYIDLTFVLQEMQKNGPIFDYEQHRALETIYPWKEKKLLDKIREVTGNPEFKPGSPPQVFDYIYNQLKLKYPFAGAHGKNAKPNTQKKTLLMLTDRHPFPQLEIDWRKISKGNSTYIIGYKYCADLNGGRLRTKWNSTGTASGRLSSGGKRQDPGVVNFQNIHGDPQMQNMCVADKRWRKVYRVIESICRKFPEDKWERIIEKWIRKHMPDLQTFLILDYGQVEVRAAAQISGDENLIADCESGDIHTTVGVVMTGWSADQIQHDKLTRTRTKNCHFGILFGISKENLYDFIVAMTPPPKDDAEAKWREENPITREFVYAAFDRYFARYTKIAEYIENQREFAREHGYCETLFGLRRKLNVNEDDDHDYYEMAESDDRGTYWGNQCVNTPVQGTAHQVLECALVNLRRQPEKYKLLGVPSMEVHDALYMMVPVLQLMEAKRTAQYLLEHESLNTIKSDFPHIDWRVPIATEAEAGLRLGTKVELDKDMSVGQFMLAWFKTCKKQMEALEKQLDEVIAG